MNKIIKVIDTETCDLESGVVEIASVDVVNGEIRSPISDFVNPQKPISIEAMAIHHITEKMIEGKPAIEEVISNYKGADYYVAHNAELDKRMLPDMGVPWICTLKLARALYPASEKHSNQYLRYLLELDVNVPEGLHAHRALYDCYVTAAIFNHIVSESGWSIEKMIEISNSPSLLHKFSFGKHAGKTFSDVAKSDRSYLVWLLNNSDGSNPDLIHTINHFLG